MITWYEKLVAWNYPRASELAPALEELGLDPEAYANPFQLAEDLRKIAIPRGWEWITDPIKEFFQWLWEIIKPYVGGIALIGGGVLLTWLLPDKYKLVGIIPIGIGAYYIYKKIFGPEEGLGIAGVEVG